MDIEIRPAVLTDLKTIQDLNYELCRKENQEFDSTVNENYPRTHPGKQYFSRKITQRNSCALVAAIKGKVIGYLVGEVSNTQSWRTLKKIAELESMFVLEEYRSKGAGTKLYTEFLAWCKAKNARVLRTTAHAKNARGLKFYQKHGFEDYEVIMEKKLH